MTRKKSKSTIITDHFVTSNLNYLMYKKKKAIVLNYIRLTNINDSCFELNYVNKHY